MKLKLFTAIAVLAGLAVASGTPEKGKGKKHREHAAIKQLIEKFDKDGDGKLNAEERKAAGEARKAEFLKKFDKDGDGELSPEEKKAAGEAIRNRVGRRPAHGKPGNRPTRRQRPQGKPEGRPERPEGEGRPERPERPEGRPERPERPAGKSKKK
tara:strand:- start:1060 stop:1524 length:465 start_codon:yes stop_codon:yes gene_type:complete